MRWPVIALVGLCGACVDIPAFAPPGAIELDGSTFRGQGFSIHFAEGDRFHYPDSFVIGSREILGASASANCAYEDGIGLALYPAPRVSGGETAPSTDDSSIDAVLRGPAIGKVRIEWRSPFTCMGPNQTRSPQGYSSFTIFPDGKVVRYDRLKETGATLVTASGCGCSGVTSPDFYVTSFWSFARSAFQTVYLPAATDLSTLQPQNINTTGASNCLEANTPGTLAVRTSWLGTPIQTRVMAPNGSVVAMVRDLQAHAATLGDLSPTVHSSTSVVAFHPGKTCADTEAADALVGAPTETVFVDGTPVPLGRDGIYGGETAGNDGGFGVAKRKVVVSGGVSEPFALMITWPGPTKQVRVTSSVTKTGTWYIPQLVNDFQAVIWFRDGLGSDMLTVEAE